MDQAGRLRALASVGSSRRNTRVISITSGKGGVGKTNVSINMAMNMGARGLKVLLVDGDFGLANANVLMGIEAHTTLDDILFNNEEFKNVFIPTPYGFDLLPGSSGVKKMLNLDTFSQRALFDRLLKHMEDYDYVIFDTAPGIAEHVLAFNSVAHDVVVVTHPEPMAITDAYALIKVLEKEKRIKKFKLLINRARDAREGLETFRRLTEVSSEFLNCSVDYFGVLHEDINVWQSTKKQMPVSALYPNSPFAVSINRLCEKLLHESDAAALNKTRERATELRSGVGQL